MKLFLIVVFAFVLAACGEEKVTPIVEDVAVKNINGTYVASDKTSFTFNNGILTKEAHGGYAARSTKYTIVNNRIEFTFDMPGQFLIKDDKTLVYRGVLEYSKK